MTHTKRTEPEHQGNVLDDSCAKATAMESIKIVTHVDAIRSASAKNHPSLPDFCHPDVLVTWQQSAPESEKLRWVNNGCKLNEWSGLLETQDGCLVLPGTLANPFVFCVYIPSSTIVHLR